MTRLPPFLIGLALVGATCVWFTTLRANDEPAELPQPDQVAQLLTRIEKLEKRITALEADKEQSTRQANAVDAGPLPRPLYQQQQSARPGQPGGQANPAPQSNEQNWPPARIRLLKLTSESGK